MEWRSVTAYEFDRFLGTYPKPLERDVAMFCEPPVANYNDFSEGHVWPESMVAKHYLAGQGNDQPHGYKVRSGPGPLPQAERETDAMRIPGACW